MVFPCFLTSTTANITIIDDSVLEETVASFNVTVLGSSVDGLPLDREAVVAITDYEGRKNFEMLLCLYYKVSII